MPSHTTAIWTGATGAAIVIVGAAAAYLAHPTFLWPPPDAAAPAAVEGVSPPRRDTGTNEAPPQPAAPTAAPSPASATAPQPKPAFDVVNVAPTGEAVVAGRAAPNAKVELRDAGKTVAEATANAAGQFVIIPPALAPGSHILILAEAGTGAELRASSPIDVAVPAPEPKAAAAAPPPGGEKAASAAEAAAQPAAARVAVHSVGTIAGGGLIARGAAEPNATVRLYLSGAYVGDAKTSADGRWSLTIEHGLTPGAYSVRADEIDPANAAVIARAEAPFDYSDSAAQPAPGGAQMVEAAAPSPADVVVDSIATHHVERGHTLWGISQKFYGDGSRYEVIFAANAHQIKNPNLIYPGQVFVVPKPQSKP